MSTFAELKDRLANARFRKAILQQVIDHLDKDFSSVAGSGPRLVLLTEEQVRVPEVAFEVFIAELVKEEVELQKKIDIILNTTVVESEEKKADAPVSAEKQTKKGKRKEKASAGRNDQRSEREPDSGTPRSDAVEAGQEEAEGAGGT